MARFIVAILGLAAIGIAALIGLRPDAALADGFFCTCTQTDESTCAASGSHVQWCGTPQDISTTANPVTGAFAQATTIKWCQQDVPEMGAFEVDARSQLTGDPTYDPAYYFPEQTGTHCGVLEVTIEGSLSSPSTDGWVDSVVWVWTPYTEDVQRLNIDGND